jgi:hypothetical protein
MLVKNYLKMGRVDAVIGGIGTGEELQRAPGAKRNHLSFLDAAREIADMPMDLGLGKVSQKTELRNLFRTLFRFDNEVIIIDPYLAVEVLRSLYDQPFNAAGLEFIVATAAQASVQCAGSLRIQLVCCCKQMKIALKQLSKRKGGRLPLNSALPELDDAIEQVEGNLRQRLLGYACDQGLAPERISVTTKWVPENSHRGLVSSRRVWNIEHSLQSLTELLDCIGKGKPLPPNNVRLQILQDDGAKAIRSLVCAAQPAGSRAASVH